MKRDRSVADRRARVARLRRVPASRAPRARGPSVRERREAIGWIGPYLLLSKIGDGGMARIYLARHRASGHICVLKQLRQELEEHAIAVTRFRREGLIASRIVHSNVARILDSGFENGRFYL